MLAHQRIVTKSLIAVLLLAVAGIAIFANAVVTLTRVKDDYKRIVEIESPALVMGGRAQRHFQMVAKDINRMFLHTDDPAVLTRLWDDASKEQKRLFWWKNGAFMDGYPDQRAALQANFDNFDRLLAFGDQVRQRVAAGDLAQAKAIIARDIDPLIERMNDDMAVQMDTNLDAWKKRSAALQDEFDTAVRHSSVLMAVGILLALAAAVLIIRRGVTQPVLRLRDAMAALRAGRLDVDIPGGDRRDEVGEMAASVLHFRDMLQETERLRAAREEEEARTRRDLERRTEVLRMTERFGERLSGIVATVNGAVGALRDAAAEQVRAAQRTERGSTEAAAAAVQARDNMAAVCEAAEAVTEAVAEISQAVSGASATARRSAEGAEASRQELEALSSAISDVDAIVQMIATVSEQTNLLALNATIEAARAGEAGKGFAVVAAEVKNLANQTRTMTEDITTKVTAVKGAATRATDRIAGILEQVTVIDGEAAAIARSVDHQTTSARAIAGNAEQARGMAEQVAGTVETLRDDATGTAKAADQVRTAADRLAEEAETLRREVAALVQGVTAA